MAITPFIRGSQGVVMAPVLGNTEIGVSQAAVLAAYTLPTKFLQTSQARNFALVNKLSVSQVSQACVMAAVLPGVKNRRSRAWGFSLDGHDFYVLRLGDAETLVFDLTTAKWSDWDSLNRTSWRVHQGAQWIDMGRAAYLNRAASQIVAGDDTTGMLWTLDPTQAYDEPDTEGLEPEYFERRVTTGAPLRMRESVRNNAVFMTADVGSPALGLAPATIELRTSDDMGKTYQSQGTVTVTLGGFTNELLWRSLGVVRAPGRIFEFTDFGATVRIDAIDAQFDEAEQ